MKNTAQKILFGSLLGLSLLAPAANAAPSAEITQMQDDISTLGDVAKITLIPIAGIVLAWQVGGRLVKRVTNS